MKARAICLIEAIRQIWPDEKMLESNLIKAQNKKDTLNPSRRKNRRSENLF